MDYRRGDSVTVVDVLGSYPAVILGGPNVLTHYDGSSTMVYTVRRVALEGGWMGKSSCVTLANISPSSVRWNHGIPTRVPMAHCPDCDEPDMIFYHDDIICAWCREKFWDEYGT